jgi:hypothetical protein
LATITNIINTLFSTSGAPDVIRDTERIGRAQTRLGQASASAGRSFAAQSAGLGGLVGAYAGAAATTFALQAAFSALANSARAAQTFEGLNALAANVGVSGDKILQSVREITNNQLTLAEAASATSLTLSAGFSTEQIEGLASVSIKASRALGRDLTDAMTRVVRGSAKMETELLDELGIYTKIEPATRAYAAALGKSVSSLSEFERRQAFANAVIEEGNRKYASINTTIPTSAEAIEAFGVKIVDLSTQLGILIADALAPLASYLTNNVAAAFSALGIAISLAGSKGVQILSASLNGLTVGILNAGLGAENFIRKYTGVQASAITATTAIKDLSIDMLRLNDIEKARITGIQTAAATRNLAGSEIKASNALIRKSITVLEQEKAAETVRRDAALANLNTSSAALKVKEDEFKAARRNVQALQQQGASTAAVTTAQQKLASAQGRLGAATAAFNRVQAANIATLDTSRAAILGLNADVARLNSTLLLTAPAATGARVAIAAFASSIFAFGSAAAGGLSLLLTGFVALASKIFLVVSIVSLIGSAFANAIGKGEEFQGLLNRIANTFTAAFSNQDVKKAKSAIQGITSANLTELEKTDAALRDTDSFTFKSKSLGFDVEITKTKAELVSEVTTLLTEASQETERTITQAATSSGAAIGGAAGLAIAAAANARYGATLGAFAGPKGAAIGGAIGAAIGAALWLYADVPELPPELTDKIKKQFASALTGLDEEVQNKLVNVLGSLEQRYGAAARFDPAARAALKVQQQLVIESGKYIKNIDAVSDLMLATGQTADKLVKNFQFDTATRQISYLSQAFTELAGRSFTFDFIDVQDEALQALMDKEYTITVPATINAGEFEAVLLSDLKNTLIPLLQESDSLATAIESTSKSMLGAMPGKRDSITALIDAVKALPDLNNIANLSDISAQVIELKIALDKLPQVPEAVTTITNLRKPIEEALGAYSSYNQASARALEVQRELGDSLQNGTATLESFTQGLANSKSALLQAEREYYAVDQAIAVLTAELKLLGAADSQLAAGLQTFIENLRASQQQTERNLFNQREITKELEAQEAIIKNQITASEFFKSFIKKPKNILNLDLEFAGVGSENLLATQIGYLSTFVTTSEEQIKKYDKIRDALKPLALGDSEIQKILTTPAEDAEKLALSLNGVNKGIKAIVDNEGKLVITTGLKQATEQISEPIELIKRAKIGVASVAEEALTAINELVRQAAENLPQFLDEKTKEIKQLVSNSIAEVNKLAQEEIILSIKFEADVEQLKRDISLIKQEAIIEQLELDIDLTSAKVDSGKLTEVQGVAEENRIRQQLLEEQRYLIYEQFGNELMAIEARRDILTAESEARETAIKAEAQLQVDKIVQDNAYISAVAGMYQAAVTSLNASADRQVKGIIDAGNNVSDSWAKTLSEGAAALNAAIVAGYNKSTEFNNAVTGASAAAVDLGTPVVDNIIKAADDFSIKAVKGINQIRLAERAKLAAEEAARKRANDLLDLEKEKVQATYEARIAANEKLRQIEDEAAIAREKKAAAGGGKRDEELTAIQKKLQTLFDSIKGNIENALMSLNNLIFYGEGNFGDIMSNLFKSIQQDLFKQTIADPLSDFLTTSLFGSLGVTKGEKGLTYEGNSLLVKVVNAAEIAMGNLPPGSEEGKGGIFGGLFTGLKSMFDKLFGEGGFLSTLFKNLMGDGGILSGLFKGLGGILGNIFGFSQGGMVHLAQGGAASSSVLRRDRVPAMLEPGEFVLRKQSARKIGLPALQAMNATGSAGGAGNISVNVTNEGSPKQAEASQPRFDGEKYVVDIVMRDIANNGPIRRSLRSRGGL